eukprot:TRINITY_DN482_c0_g2_i7.p1 TRINITY_DN482_c0_g2~~TRINITY_DN482_c0_g2_i7.p1  ORF type:complete len:715 (-),score=167.23 TRINITY_DN482_c0_g2_i7:835-2979(-)
MITICYLLISLSHSFGIVGTTLHICLFFFFYSAGPLSSSPQIPTHSSHASFSSNNTHSNLNERVLPQNTNKSPFDDNNYNNHNPSRFPDFHFNTRPVLNTGSQSHNTFTTSPPPLTKTTPSSRLPLLTHDSVAVEQRKRSKLFFDSREKPWVQFNSLDEEETESKPPPPQYRKKYIPISLSKSSSACFSRQLSGGGGNSDAFITRYNNNSRFNYNATTPQKASLNPFLSINKTPFECKTSFNNNNPFTKSPPPPVKDHNNNDIHCSNPAFPFDSSSIFRNHPVIDSSSSSNSSISDNILLPLVGTSFFQSLSFSLPSPPTRVVDDSSVTNTIADPYRSSAAATSLLQSGAGGRQSPEPSSSALVDPSSPSLLNALNSLFMPSPAGGGGGGPSNNLLVSPPPPALNSANNNNTSSSSSSLSNNNSNNTSKVVDKSHKQSYEDRYAALKDLDDIFRTAHISSDNIGSESNGVGSGFLGGGSTHPPAPAPSLNGVSSIFGSGESMITGGGSTSSNCGSTNSIMPSFFDSPQTKNNTDSWKRLSSNSVDNSGWANFGSNSATTPSSNSSTSIASNPFNNLVGGTSHNHHQQQLSSQLNTSPWPTTGTSPVQNAFSSSNTGPNGLSDPFSVSNQSFQNSSEKLTNDLFANAPMPNGGSKTSNLNQPGENPFSSSQLLDNALGSPGAAAAAAASNPWDASPFTDNNNIATPTFNPKNPFL